MGRTDGAIVSVHSEGCVASYGPMVYLEERPAPAGFQGGGVKRQSLPPQSPKGPRAQAGNSKLERALRGGVSRQCRHTTAGRV